jgi:putative PIN family toxin of toxin-antitoxin system
VKIILDTNVFVSGVFFSGPPYQILKAWREGQIQLIISPEILDEYYRVGKELAKQFHGVDLDPIIGLLTVKSQLIAAPPLSESVCEDQDDDKFLACALASGTNVIVSGDRHLLKVSGFHGVEIIRPRRFIENYL